MNKKDPVWRREAITLQVESVLEKLLRADVLSRFYLAGGAGLALHLGHRRSHDLDFFSADPVDSDALIERLHKIEKFSVVCKTAETLHATLEDIKVSFLGYAYPTLFSMELFLGVKVADPRDIAGMKISAIAGRGTKRDFVDLYFIAKQFGLRQLLEWFERKYARVNYNRVRILKSLTYFEEQKKTRCRTCLSPYRGRK